MQGPMKHQGFCSAEQSPQQQQSCLKLVASSNAGVSPTRTGGTEPYTPPAARSQFIRGAAQVEAGRLPCRCAQRGSSGMPSCTACSSVPNSHLAAQAGGICAKKGTGIPKGASGSPPQRSPCSLACWQPPQQLSGGVSTPRGAQERSRTWGLTHSGGLRVGSTTGSKPPISGGCS